ncbi:MAG TPA: hypothetical protein VG621_03540, partial [Candidatus Paceibacterota bacterium]|nr:hypothetical protein [Candidatus Paceibacterota bacterium]
MKHALKYIMVLLLTAGIFVASWYLSASINRHKFAALQAAQNKMSVDILSSETQFDLLKQNSCDDSGASVFADDLATLADKIAYSEQNFGSSDDIATLKQQYTLLEVRDFLLTKQVAERCHEPDPQTIFYFYGTKEGCPDCVKESYVLDALHQNNPYLRVYSFDYNLDLSTIKALR